MHLVRAASPEWPAGEVRCPIWGPERSCAALTECICALAEASEDREHCRWAVLGPRALPAMGDFCADGSLSLDELLAVEDWQHGLASGLEFVADPVCAALSAR